MNETPFIKKFEVDGHRYVYDVNRNAFFKVDELVCTLIDGDSAPPTQNIRDKFPEESVTQARQNLDAMKLKGFFSSHRPQVTYFHTLSKQEFSAYVRDILDTKLNRLILVLSEGCNMRCKYCSYSGEYRYTRGHSDKHMSIEMMKKAVDFYFKHSPEIDKKHLSFYGGEPLLNFPLMKECIRYVREKYDGPMTYNTTVNGTLLTPERVRFLVENDFALLVSVDGPKPIHDRNRVFKNSKGTFERVIKNLKALKKAYPDYYRKKVRFNAVLSPPLDTEAIDAFISDEEIKPANVSFTGVNGRYTTYFDQFTKEQLEQYSAGLGKVREHYYQSIVSGEAPSEFAKKLYGKRFVQIHQRSMEPLPAKIPSDGQCILGTRSMLVNVDGSFNFCTQVDDVYNLGSIDDGFDYEGIDKIYSDLDAFLGKHCHGCWAIRFCGKCIKDLNKNGQLNDNIMPRYCAKKRTTILNEIKDYIRIRHRNPHALDYLSEIEVF